ncbi:hypothetical protein AAFF_G00084260 [Aldrovandia affinis]|uniref:G protein-coupled receptor 157 n=1 Tax=Aldrovandia affinis TaxID=143900 RepID=A0AAD7RXE9_9TELE|nr:hypothetical protein AAFF_G00084260 [Aldrovandia affinis]
MDILLMDGQSHGMGISAYLTVTPHQAHGVPEQPREPTPTTIQTGQGHEGSTAGEWNEKRARAPCGCFSGSVLAGCCEHAALSEYRPILANSSLFQSRSSMADRKMTLIPIIFIALRIWSTLRFLLMLTDSPARQSPLLVTLHGIGNTFQGAANCIMFVLFTKPVRSRLAGVCCCCRRVMHRSTDTSIQESPSMDPPPRQEDTTPRRWGEEDC